MRLRLTLWIAVVITLVLWVTVVIFWLYQRAAMNNMFIDLLEQRAAGIAAQLDTRAQDVTSEELDNIAAVSAREVEYETLRLAVFSLAGDPVVVQSGMSVIADGLPLEEAGQSIKPIFIRDPKLLRSVVQSTDAPRLDSALLLPVVGQNGQQFILFVAASDRNLDRQILIVDEIMLGAALIAPGLGLLSGWFVSGIAVAPLRRIQDLVKQLGPEQLDRSILSPSNSSEVSELIRELDDARKRIREAFQAQERFLANVSHEIKTPIAVLLIEAQTLDMDGLPDEIVHFVDSAQSEMSRLGKLVESFLTLTRIEDGAGEIRGKRYSANDLAMDSVEHCAAMANQLGVWLRPRLFSDEETIDLCVSGEPELLTTMLDNLIHNAIGYSPRDTGVEIVLSDEGDRIGFAVRDSGPGIEEAQLVTIFDRFKQSKQHERRARGHGLGLSIAKGIAELHRGTLTVRNLERGCEFKVYLPKAHHNS